MRNGRSVTPAIGATARLFGSRWPPMRTYRNEMFVRRGSDYTRLNARVELDATDERTSLGAQTRRRSRSDPPPSARRLVRRRCCSRSALRRGPLRGHPRAVGRVVAGAVLIGIVVGHLAPRWRPVVYDRRRASVIASGLA